jgi:large conductance mechanosensitive channel
MGNLLKEFQKFIQRGNVVDLAVGVIMGAAFGKIVNSLVSDVLMPPIGYVVGGVDFKDLKFSLPQIDPARPAVDIKYGMFLQTTFDFLIVAGCIFVVIKAMNAFHKKEEATPPPAPATPQEKLLTEIRDLLAKMAQ